MSQHDLFLKFNAETEQFEPKRLQATFFDRDEKRVKFDDTEQYWRDFVNKWWHHDRLSFKPLVLTEAQQARLDEVNGQEDLTEEHLSQVSDYVQYGVVEAESTVPYLEALKDAPEVSEARMARIKTAKREALAAVRFAHETGGVETPTGVKVITTRESQSQLGNAYNTLKEGLRSSVDWKSPSGWVAVTLEEIAPIAQFASAHVQVSFSAERLVDENLISAAETEEELQELDLAEAFMSAYQDLMAAELPGE
jgi:hypothetical protein